MCARTYAYGHSNSYAYPDVKGNMDDTVSFQVYNQGTESAETNEAIRSTAGQILMKDGLWSVPVLFDILWLYAGRHAFW